MTLPPEISKLSRRQVLTKLNDLSIENEKLKADLSRYQKAPGRFAFLKEDLHIFQNQLRQVSRHTAVLLLSISAIWVSHRVGRWLLGSETFFDWIPIRYFLDPAHIAVVLKFLVFVIKDVGPQSAK